MNCNDDKIIQLVYIDYFSHPSLQNPQIKVVEKEVIKEVIKEVEKPFIVPEGMSFSYSENIDFSKLNLELKKDGYYPRFFYSCKDCKIDTSKLKLNEISKNCTEILSYITNTEIIGELPTIYDNKNYFSYWSLEKMTDEYVFDLAEKISNMKNFIDGKLKGSYMFYNFPSNSNFRIYNYGYSQILGINRFPVLDLSKWNVNYVDQGSSEFFYDAKIYRLKIFVPTSVVRFRLNQYQSLNVEIFENYDFSKFRNGDFQESSFNPSFYIFYGDNLGAISDITTYYFTNAVFWGSAKYYTHLENIQGEIFDRTTPEESRQSIIYTLIEHSFDRQTAGYPTCTIYLHNNTKSVLTEEEIAQITAKGFSIA